MKCTKKIWLLNLKSTYALSQVLLMKNIMVKQPKDFDILFQPLYISSARSIVSTNLKRNLHANPLTCVWGESGVTPLMSTPEPQKVHFVQMCLCRHFKESLDFYVGVSYKYLLVIKRELGLCSTVIWNSLWLCTEWLPVFEILKCEIMTVTVDTHTHTHTPC